MTEDAGRECGPCSLCCTVLRVDELRKLGGVPCEKLGPPGTGCSIHATRPSICRRYRCLWLQGKLDDGDRPDRLGAVLDLVSEAGMPILEIREATPGATERSPRLQEIAERFRRTTTVRITDTHDVLSGDAAYRLLLPNGETRLVEGDTTTISHPDGRTETTTLPWLDRTLRRAVLALQRLRLSRWR